LARQGDGSSIELADARPSPADEFAEMLGRGRALIDRTDSSELLDSAMYSGDSSDLHRGEVD